MWGCGSTRPASVHQPGLFAQSPCLWERHLRLSFRFKPVGMLGAHQPRSAGVEAGWAGQAALVVVGRFFLGFLVGFLIAG